MAFMLGSLTNGMFGAANSVFGMYDLYQKARAIGQDTDTRQKVFDQTKAAVDSSAGGQSGGKSADVSPNDAGGDGAVPGAPLSVGGPVAPTDLSKTQLPQYLKAIGAATGSRGPVDRRDPAQPEQNPGAAIATSGPATDSPDMQGFGPQTRSANFSAGQGPTPISPNFPSEVVQPRQKPPVYLPTAGIPQAVAQPTPATTPRGFGTPRPAHGFGIPTGSASAAPATPPVPTGAPVQAMQTGSAPSMANQQNPLGAMILNSLGSQGMQ